MTVRFYRLELQQKTVHVTRPQLGVSSIHKQSLIQEEKQIMLQKGEITELHHWRVLFKPIPCPKER